MACAFVPDVFRVISVPVAVPPFLTQTAGMLGKAVSQDPAGISKSVPSTTHGGPSAPTQGCANAAITATRYRVLNVFSVAKHLLLVRRSDRTSESQFLADKARGWLLEAEGDYSEKSVRLRHACFTRHLRFIMIVAILSCLSSHGHARDETIYHLHARRKPWRARQPVGIRRRACAYT